MRRNARFFETTNASSVLNQDQLEQLVSRNQSFLRDFLLVVCCVIVFIIVLMFILLIVSINKSLELSAAAKMERQRTFLANLDLRTRTTPNVINLNKPQAASLSSKAEGASL
ncbi:ac108-like protein [Alphabaculovirus altersperidaniae]|uniref:Ac108-like protein n=1 Tax=Spodoptera eridania nucleopolyhedrovirus TaxID=2315721 RepID=A0ABX6TQD5_9ABAC|nr:ac108-like protein [Spodoptera eridania nucleopolyhedrovirus]QNV47875.1 ac108-like protein [Spodoptera eridania nucleopolyhedrovirus]